MVTSRGAVAEALEYISWPSGPQAEGALMLVALIRLVDLNMIGNLLILISNLPRCSRLRRRTRWVRLVLKDPLPARPPMRSFLARRAVPSLALLERALDELAKDPRLVGVIVDLDAPS